MRSLNLFFLCLVFLGINLGGYTQTFQNGLTKISGNVVELGGINPLVRNTDIDLGASYYFNLKKNSSNYFTVLNGGNVGIGISPAYKLDVNGTLRTTGFLFSSGAGIGKVFTSDQFGNGSWQTPASGGGSSQWTTNGSHIYYNTGNVGINTTNPGYKLHVTEPSANTLAAVFEGGGGAGILRVRPISGSGAVDIGFTGTGNDMFIMGTNVTSGFRIVGASSPLHFETDLNLPIRFKTNNTERMIIDGSGNIGIGTSNPTSKLHVHGNSFFSSYLSTMQLNATKLQWRGTPDGLLNGFQGDDGSLEIQGVNNLTQTLINGSSMFFRAQNFSDIRFQTTNNNTDRIVIQNDGNIGIGTASAAVKLHVAGAVRIEGGISSIATSGTYNERFGLGALSSLTVASSHNTAIGYNAMNLYNSVNGAHTAIGYNVLSKASTGTGNTGVGFNALSEYVGSIGLNTALGFDALRGNLGSFTGYHNIGIGYQAGYNLTSGHTNTFIGNGAGQNVTTGYGNTVVSDAPLTSASSYNVVVGGASSSGSGNFNISIGYQAGNPATLTGSNNLFMGYASGLGITSGTGNVILGHGASGVGRTSNNIIIGNGAGGTNITNGGSSDIWLGAYTGQYVTTSSESVIIGDQAAYSTDNTTSSVLIGKWAGNGAGTLPSVANSVIIGRSAYQYAQNGTNSVAIGTYAGYNTTPGDRTGNVFLGYGSGFNQNVSNRLFIENSTSANPLIYGEFDNRIVKINNKLYVNSLVTTGTAPTTSGTTKMVVTDANGQLSFKDEPSGGGGGSSQWSTAINNNDIYYNTGNVGIGTSSPSYKLDVNGGAHFGGNTPLTSVVVTPNGDIGVGTTPITNMAIQVQRNADATAGIRFENTNTGHNSFTALQFGYDVNTAATKFLNIGYANPNIMPYGVFHAAGSHIVSYGEGGLNMSAYNAAGGAPKMRFYTGNGVTDANLRMTIDENGRVGIGIATIPTGYQLAVAGNIITEKVRVKLQSTGWPDYVFHHKYELLSLKDLESFIQKNKHLPDVPSATEVETNGLDLGDNQSILLKKVEELTLYIIEINKKVDKLAEENALLKKKLESNKK